MTPPLRYGQPVLRPGRDLHRLAGGDDVVVDERAHVDLLLHPVGPLRGAAREAGRRAAAVRSAPEASRAVERLDPAVRREEVEGRRPPVEGPSRRRDPEHGRLLAREVDARRSSSSRRARPSCSARDWPKRSQFSQSSAAADGRAPAPATIDGDDRRRPPALPCRGRSRDGPAPRDDAPARGPRGARAAPIAIVFRDGRIVAGQPTPTAMTAAATNGLVARRGGAPRQNAAAASTTRTWSSWWSLRHERGRRRRRCRSARGRRPVGPRPRSCRQGRS